MDDETLNEEGAELPLLYPAQCVRVCVRERRGEGSVCEGVCRQLPSSLSPPLLHLLSPSASTPSASQSVCLHTAEASHLSLSHTHTHTLSQPLTHLSAAA